MSKVVELCNLLGQGVLLLHCPLGKKFSKNKWGHLTPASMLDAKYVRRLETGNIGVALGAVSGGLCSIDWDNDDWMERFLSDNPNLRSTLITTGARGCNIWVRMLGDYPNTHSFGAGIGEWRSTGSQTIIRGKHPSGTDYRYVSQVRPLLLRFEELVWPAGIKKGWQAKTADVLPTVPSVLTVPSDPSGSLSGPQVGCPWPSDFFSDCTVDERGQSNRKLWDMAGKLKSLERRLGRTTTGKERTAIFCEWWKASKEHVDQSMDQASYYSKWCSAATTRRQPDDLTAVETAWHNAQDLPLPPAATRVYDIEMSSKMRMLVALCYQLQLHQGDNPFFLTQRKAGELLDTPHRTVGYWLKALCAADGPFPVLKKVSSGSQKEKRANEYLFLDLAKL